MVSKIGKIPISTIGVQISLKQSELKVTGPKGEITLKIPREVTVSQEADQIIMTAANSKVGRCLHGLTRTLVANAALGVVSGWSKSLELVGTGYRAALAGDDLSVSVGFSHPVIIKPTTGIKFTVDQNKITVTGADKGLVGQVAARIRQIRPPEPYKGKGIKYVDEKIRRKAGKTAKAIGATAAK
jgi:large subunit ribosomal protein L6